MNPDLFAAIGTSAGCYRLAEAFYARVDSDPLLRPLFPGTTLRCAIEAFGSYLVQILGGPGEDSQHRWWVSLTESHGRFAIGAAERDRWLQLMTATLGDLPLPTEARQELQRFFEAASCSVVNQGPKPAAGKSAIFERQRTADLAVEAITKNDARGAIRFTEQLDPASSLSLGLLARMIRSRDAALREFVLGRLNAGLVPKRYFGRTLLHEAAAAGDLAVAARLLDLGARADERSAGGHTPLYCLANECETASGALLVKVLVERGADPNAADNAKRCTPLHMAARRGFREVAAALLDCGANLEARDKAGDTPLRRAVNCGQAGVVELLVSRGADGDSVGSHGRTPRTAARNAAVRNALSPG